MAEKEAKQNAPSPVPNRPLLSPERQAQLSQHYMLATHDGRSALVEHCEKYATPEERDFINKVAQQAIVPQ